MDHAARVGELQRSTDLNQRLDVERQARMRFVEGSVARDVGGQVDAVDALHHEQRRAGLVDPERMNGDDAGVLEHAGHPRLAQQRARDGFRRATLQGLDRHLAIERPLPREVHAAHAPLAEGRHDLELGPWFDG